MNTKQRSNLQRLLAPKHIAFIGGSDADYSARQCASQFDGPVWGVNPKRTELGGQPCFPTVKDLPEAPDAVFLATPRAATLQVLRDLNDIDAGGVVCFTAGYSETGDHGKQAEQALIEAAGDLALVGPNCYGFISYVNNAILWPFGAGDNQCEKGIALIMQSGMISANMAMNQRSAPIAYVVSAGNQSMLAIEDYIDIFVDDPKVTSIGIYLEGIKNIERFATVSLRALRANKPIVVLKAGRSRIGAQLTVSHTGSLSGADEAHQALFDQVGIIRVESPESMIELLKFLSISGVPNGKNIAAFTCSGGDALLVADYCEKHKLALPQPSTQISAELTELLPDIATVSNPLDYTTPLWGNTEIMPKVFATAFKDQFDAAVFIQDYAPDHIDPDNIYYTADARSFIGAVKSANIPAGICSDLSENINKKSRDLFVELGVTPLQGIDHGLGAIQHSIHYSAKRNAILDQIDQLEPFRLINTVQAESISSSLLNEWECKQQLCEFGLVIPNSYFVPIQESNSIVDKANDLGYPLVMKLVGNNLAHKTEIGAVAVNLQNESDVHRTINQMEAVVEKQDSQNAIQGFLIESMVLDTIHELLVGIRRDPQFGLVMVIASGGVLVELINDSRTLLLPTTESSIKQALSSLQCYPLLTGYRGQPQCNIEALVSTIFRLAEFAETCSENLVEMDINPLMVLQNESIIVDAVIRQTESIS